MSYIRKEYKNMNKPHYGAPYTHKISLRLTDEQYEFLQSYSESCGVTVNEYVRMFVNAGLVQARKLEEEQAKEARKKARKARK